MTRRYEIAVGTIDGANDTFDCSTDYQSGTVRILSPLLQAEAQVTELGGKTFQVTIPPLSGDLLMVTYRSII